MVQLQFSVDVEANFQSVWKYFSRFENVPDWDPNTTQCQVIRKNEKEVGSVYNILSVFNGKESTLSYETTKFQQSKERGYISLQGRNDMITANDEITCLRRSQNSTRVLYRAEISLRGFYWLFTPFIKSGLKDLQTKAKEGCIKKSIQKWGKAK